MKKFLAVGVFLATVTSAVAMEPLNSIVAFVNDDAITRLEVDVELTRLQKTLSNKDVNLSISKLEALDLLIDRLLQLQHADLLAIKVPDEILIQRLEELKKRWQASDDNSDFVRIAEEQTGMSYQFFLKRLSDDIRIQSLVYNIIYQQTEVKDSEVDDFIRNETDIFTPLEYNLQHILIADDDLLAAKKKASFLRERLVAGDDFATIAREESADASATNGGLLGFLEKKELPDVFVQALSDLSVGKISPVLKSKRGFHLFLLKEKRGGKPRLKTVEQFFLQHLHLSIDDEQLAGQIYQQITEGEDFDLLVKEHSIDERSSSQHGNLGWFNRETIPPFFASGVNQLKEGEVSPPLKSPFGWHLVRLVQHKRDTLNLDNLREQAFNVLLENKAVKRREEWLKSLRENAHITILAPDLLPPEDDGL